MLDAEAILFTGPLARRLTEIGDTTASLLGWARCAPRAATITPRHRGRGRQAHLTARGHQQDSRVFRAARAAGEPLGQRDGHRQRFVDGGLHVAARGRCGAGTGFRASFRVGTTTVGLTGGAARDRVELDRLSQPGTTAASLPRS
jgi:hypothetical protein